MRSGRGSITPHLTELVSERAEDAHPSLPSLFRSYFLPARRKINHRPLPQRLSGAELIRALLLAGFSLNLGPNPMPDSAIRAYGYGECKNRKKRTAAASGWRNTIMPQMAGIFRHETDLKSPPFIEI